MPKGNQMTDVPASTTQDLNFAGIVERIVPLVAELFATLASRNPLRMHFADIANQTLLDMVEVLRQDGVSQEAIAASLGLTINGFRAKMKQLRDRFQDRASSDESAPSMPRTLLERVFSHIEDQPSRRGVTWGELQQYFGTVKLDSLRGVVHFLVKSGLLSVTGSGKTKTYRVVHRTASGPGLIDAMVLLFREGPLTETQLAQRLNVPELRARVLIDQLATTSRLRSAPLDDGTTGHTVTEYHVPVDSPEGYEAALFDHLSTVVRAICKKVRAGQHTATMRDVNGGATFSFDVPVGTPLAEEVRGFLSRMRPQLDAWLTQSEAAIREAPDAERERVTIYLGQMTESLP
jgi:predicted ArsR family transcriptional regulator